MKRCSTLSVIRERQIKITVRDHLILTRMVRIKKMDKSTYKEF